MSERGYDPATAVKGLMAGLKQTEPRPLGQLVGPSGDAYELKQRPETLCFFLLEALSGAPLPSDFADLLVDLPDLGRGKAVIDRLKRHARPDHGTYVGTYSLGHYGDEVIVFGDALLEQAQIAQTVHAFRLFHAEQAAGLPVRTRVLE